MRILDLFCGAGGAAMGYYQTFGPDTEIVGVDIVPQKRFPFEFVQADALEFMQSREADGFDLYHASPPCQAWSKITAVWGREHEDLVKPTRDWLKTTGKPYVIENVPGAPLLSPVMLCGTMFGLRVRRHRLFECDPVIWMAPRSCSCKGKPTKSWRGGWSSFDNGAELITITGHAFKAEDGRKAMEIDWMTRDELAQAIPPAYTAWIGKQIQMVLQ